MACLKLQSSVALGLPLGSPSPPVKGTSLRFAQGVASFSGIRAANYHAKSPCKEGKRRSHTNTIVCQSPPSTLTDEPKLKVPSSFDYNERMKRQMRNPYEYHHDLGMYYTRISDNLIVGSQPQTPEDIEKLKNTEGVTAILNLQQDHDITYWGIDIKSIRQRCHEVGIKHYRRPAQDFDPHSLRHQLPVMASVLDKVISQGGTVYVHCTAGLGRAPAAAIAYLFWFGNRDLETAYEAVTSKRPCGPKKEAIRGATYDLAKNSPYQPPFEHLPDFAFKDVAQWERDLIRSRVRGLYHED